MVESVLSINGSDGTGGAGIQSDIKTAASLGAIALTAITSVTAQDSVGVRRTIEVPTDIVIGQIRAVYGNIPPKAIKIGMIGNANTIRMVRDEIIACKNIVCSLVIHSSDGTRLIGEFATDAMIRHIIPVSRLLVMKCVDAETVLGVKINTDDEMLRAAESLHEMGAEWVMLRGGKIQEGRVTALLLGKESHTFFSSFNTEGWRKHGIAGALSSAITTRLAFGDDVPTAVSNAHKYMHSQVVYATKGANKLRPQELYNRFITILPEHYVKEHEVSFYASYLAISPRYLSQITRQTIGKSPKAIIDEFIFEKACKLLLNTSLSIQEISIRLGFSSPILFSRFIKQKSGLTPKNVRGEVRRRYRELGQNNH